MAITNSTIIPDWFRTQEEEASQMSLTNSELAKRWANLGKSPSLSVSSLAPTATPSNIWSQPSMSNKTSTPAVVIPPKASLAPSASSVTRIPTAKEMETAGIPLVHKPENYRITEQIEPPRETISTMKPQSTLQNIIGLNKYVGGVMKESAKQTLTKDLPQFALGVLTSPYTAIIKPLVESAYSLRSKEATYDRLADKFVEQTSLLSTKPASKDEALQIVQSDWKAAVPAITGFIFDFAPLIFLSAKGAKTGVSKTPQVKTVGIEPITKNQLIDHISGRPLTDKPMTPEQIKVVNESGVKELLFNARGSSGEINIYKFKDTLASKLLQNIEVIKRNPNKFFEVGKINTNVLKDIENTLKSEAVTTKAGAYSGLLPERAGYIPTEPSKPFWKIPAGLSIEDVKMKPVDNKNISKLPKSEVQPSTEAEIVSNALKNREARLKGEGWVAPVKAFPTLSETTQNKATQNKATQFISPNVKENLTFEEATSNINTPEYKQKYETISAIYNQDNIAGELETAIGDWSDGAEETFIKNIDTDISDEARIYSLAKSAKLLRQKDAIDFKFDPAGKDEIYIIDPKGKTVKEIKQLLDSNEIQYKTLGNQKVYVINSGEYFDKGMIDTMKKISDENDIDIDVNHGTATFITKVDDREAAQKIYDNIINNYEQKYVYNKQGAKNQGVTISRESVPQQEAGQTQGTTQVREGTAGPQKGEIIKRPPSLVKLGVVPPSPQKVTITSRPDILLRKKLGLEQRASKLGYKAGAYAARIKLIDQFRTAQENIKEIKTQVVDYLKENLPLNVRGKFLTMVKDVHTQDGLAKAFFRADKEIANVAKKELIVELKKNINRINNSEQIAVDYKAKIKDIINAIELPRHQAATINRLQKTKDYIKKQEELGNDVEMPKKVLEALEILERKPLSEMSFVEVSLLNDKILAIEQLGKTKWRTLRSLYDIEKQRIKQELVENTFPIESREKIRPGIGENLTRDEKVKNIISRAYNFVQRVDLAITPMDVVFDLLDGSVGYTGSNYKNIKKRLDSDFGGYLDLKDKYRDQILSWSKNYGLDDNNFDRIGIYAAKVQEGGMEKLINSGYSEQEINKVVLTDNEMAFYEIMRKNLDAFRPIIEDVMRTVYNKPVGKVENYFSFMTDWDAMDSAEVFQRITSPEEHGSMLTKKPEMGFTKERTGAGKQKIKINAREIYEKHIDNAAYLVTMAQNIKMAFEIVNSPEYKAVAGSIGQRIVLEWLDLMARKGSVASSVQIPVLDWLRKNTGAAVLGFRLSSTLLQPTALLDGASLLGNYAFRGVWNTFGPHGEEWIKFLRNNFPEQRNRSLDDPAYIELGKGRIREKFQKTGFWPMKKLDELTARAVTSGAYMKYLDEHNIPLNFNKPNYEAISYAELMLRQTQASPLEKDVPSAISRGTLTGNKSVDKFLLQFQNFLLKRWSLLRHDLYQVSLKLPDPLTSSYKSKKRNFKEASNIVLYLTMAVLASIGIRKLTKKVTGSKQSDSDFEKDMIKEFLTTIPFVSQFVSMAIYKSEPIPAYSPFKKMMAEGFSALTGQGKKEDTKLRHWINFLSSSGAFLGYSGSTQMGDLLRNATYKIFKKKTPSSKTENAGFEEEKNNVDTRGFEDVKSNVDMRGFE